MSLASLQFGLSVLSLVMTLGFSVYAWLVGRASARAGEVAALASRVTTLEERVRHLPDLDRLIEMHGDMQAVKAELSALRDSIRPIAAALDRINEYLLRARP